MRAMLSFPFSLIQAGGVATLAGTIVAMAYVALAMALLRLLFRIGNYIAVKPVDGVAIIANKRVIASHKEWQGRYMVNVPESKVLDLIVRGTNVTFAPPEWIYERTVKGASLPVRFRQGRLNGGIVVDRVMYL